MHTSCIGPNNTLRPLWFYLKLRLRSIITTVFFQNVTTLWQCKINEISVASVVTGTTKMKLLIINAPKTRSEKSQKTQHYFTWFSSCIDASQALEALRIYMHLVCNPTGNRLHVANFCLETSIYIFRRQLLHERCCSLNWLTHNPFTLQPNHLTCHAISDQPIHFLFALTFTQSTQKERKKNE
jgi:hypothetical protein